MIGALKVKMYVTFSQTLFMHLEIPSYRESRSIGFVCFVFGINYKEILYFS